MKIAAAAQLVGVEAHVRHWEDMRVLNPTRTPSGHRDYDTNTIDHARMVRIAQRVGFSLTEIREFAQLTADQRQAAVATRREAIHQHIDFLQRTDGFLQHLISCTHPVIAECPGCSGYLEAVT